MLPGGKPAYDLEPFAGRKIVSALQTQGDNKQIDETIQVLSAGNRCNHDKNNFKFFISPHHYKKRPHTIEEALRRLKEIEHTPHKYGSVVELFFHPKSKGGRKRRSERREANNRLVLAACINALNLQKMALGYYNNRNEFHYSNYAALSLLAGISQIRFKRSMKDLQQIGILKVFSIRQLNQEGHYRTKEVRIEFTDKIFEMLHLMREFLDDREKACIKFTTKQRNLDKKAQKKEFYRHKSFASSRKTKNPIIKDLTKRIIKSIAPVQAGNGIEIREKINALISKGISIKDAIAIVRQQYPPPLKH